VQESDTKVSQLDVALRVQKNVLHLEVAVRDAVQVHVPEGQYDLDQQELQRVFRNAMARYVLHHREQVSGGDKVHDEVEFTLALEGKVERDDERVVQGLENVFLVEDLVDVVSP
jgi:hypothetical protein